MDHAVTLAERIRALVGTWGLPPDTAATVALGLALVLALGAANLPPLLRLAPILRTSRLSPRSSTALFLGIASLGAALLSMGYVDYYLRGGPRIIDATSYYWQGRALSHGAFTWTPFEPSASFRGRFFLFREDAIGQGSLGGIFPPGYPLLLAGGFVLGAPMLVGPALAAALVIATYFLARALSEPICPALADPIAKGAALLSIVCAALRYHTADTMSHGATALGITVAFTSALYAARRGSPPRDGSVHALVAGFALGFVAATRPVSAMAAGLVVVCVFLQVSRSNTRRYPLLLLLLASMPGFVLLACSQRAVTGAWFSSTQRLYYALSDGPPGCFRWGFGEGIGCLFEHGDFVASRLPSGYGFLQAVGTTLRRLREHSRDIANVEPLALLWLIPIVLRRHDARVRHVTAAVGLHFLAYAPFYFDGDYPGGGARFFADVLPIEHALTMLGLALLTSRVASISAGALFTRATLALLSFSLGGFAVHGSFEHGKLRDREGGRPMFEPSALARAGATKGLVFVDTDHGFSLGHDLSANVRDGVVVARFRGDDRDRLVYEALGRPSTWLYRFDPSTSRVQPNAPVITPFLPRPSSDLLRFEAEAEWPPLEQHEGFAVPAWSIDCVSGRRALVVIPTSSEPASVTIALPIPEHGRYEVTPVIAPPTEVPFARTQRADNAMGTARLGTARWAWRAPSTCVSLEPRELELEPPRARITFEASGGAVAIDAFLIRRVP
jgi:hypothetical protein